MHIALKIPCLHGVLENMCRTVESGISQDTDVFRPEAHRVCLSERPLFGNRTAALRAGMVTGLSSEGAVKPSQKPPQALMDGLEREIRLAGCVPGGGFSRRPAAKHGVHFQEQLQICVVPGCAVG